jgi:hypothetical protein
MAPIMDGDLVLYKTKLGSNTHIRKGFMMSLSLEQIWQQLCKKDSRLAQPETVVDFKSENLKKLLAQVYEQGQKSTKSNFDSGLGWFDGLR